MVGLIDAKTSDIATTVKQYEDAIVILSNLLNCSGTDTDSSSLNEHLLWFDVCTF